MNSDSLQTYLGFGKAVVVTAGAASLTQDLQSPALWMAIVYAIIEAVKGYYAAGVKPTPTP